MQADIERLFDARPDRYTDADLELFARFKQLLNRGEARAAEPGPAATTGWRVNGWVKKGVLIGFRIGAVVDMSIDLSRQPWIDKATYPVKRIGPADGIRIVPGGSSIRDRCFVGRGVTCMPPMYINTGAHVGDGTMIDSHALVGSCTQVGTNAISLPPRSSAASSSPSARCRSPSRTTCSWVETAASSRKRS